jgi:tRNA threonylcarbamoyladenosine biosynthesis protein TsaB
VILLALDTCLAACSVALSRDGEPIAWASEPMIRGHQERLAPMTRDLMASRGLAFAQIDRIGVTVGPGSFTGLRVGLAFAKGLSLALGRSCVGVGVLEALATGIWAAGISGAGPTAAVIDAGRGRVYLQLFDGGVSLSGPDILTVELAISRLAEVFPSGQMALTGPGAPLLTAAAPLAILDQTATPDPRVVARLASLAPPTPPRPLYLRPPDAKVKAA